MNITVGYFSHPPFSDFVHGRAEGVFWDLLQPALNGCLGPGVTFYMRRFANEDALLKGGLLDCNLSFPVTKGPLYSALPPSAFIPVLRTPGAVWLDPTAGPHESASMSQLRVVAQAWPLLLIILVSCSFAAVLVWFMERLKNPQEFPRPFVRGFWEGWWWAFITMTTVGYGDRSPKTIVGRLFAMLWISFGLVLISMFTAVVTAALSQSAQGPEEDYRFFQTNITVINGSYEQVLVYELGSTPIGIADWQSLMLLAPDYDSNNSTDSNPVIGKDGSSSSSNDTSSDEAPHHGALIEHFMYLHMRQEHPGRMRSLKPQLVLKRPSVRGVHSNLPAKASACLAEAMLKQQISVYSLVIGHQHVEDRAQEQPVAVEVAQSLFSTSNKHLGIVAAVFGIVFIALLIWEKLYWQPRNPEYKFVEMNWKYERQKKEAEFGRQLDFKAFYRSSRRGEAPRPRPEGPQRQARNQEPLPDREYSDIAALSSANDDNSPYKRTSNV